MAETDFNMVYYLHINTLIEHIKNSSQNLNYNKNFLSVLQEQGYEYLNIDNEKDLILNLCYCIEELNNIKLTDNKRNAFLSSEISKKNIGLLSNTNNYLKGITFLITTGNIMFFVFMCIFFHKYNTI